MEAANKSKIAIVWFRNDMRLLDNLSLSHSCDLINKKKIDAVLPFYCFDKETFEGISRQAKLPRCGPYRRNFLIESVENLHENLSKKLKSNLFISYGSVEVELMKLIEQLEKNFKIDVVISSKEIPSEEVEVETKLARLLKEKNINLLLLWESTMIHLDDLPYDNISKFPDVFTTFRKNVEIKGESNYKVQNVTDLKIAHLPTCVLEGDWGRENYPKKAEIATHASSAIGGFKGGEDAALDRVLEYFFKSDGLKNYKTTRNGMIGKSYSSKLSMWLATGNVSARYLYWKVKEFEAKHRANESTKHFAFELLWRDFFKFNSYKHGKGIFYLNGCNSVNQQKASSFGATSNYSKKWKTDENLFEKWCNGETGYPFVDANMKELKETGWMSNRGRQNVASFLTKDLEIDWRYGAEWFETMLIDYDCTSNWGNWQYAGGVGADPRTDRYFNVIKQAYDYDEEGAYARMWIPQLANVQTKFVYCPYLMSLHDQKRVNCLIGKDYPEPIVKTKSKWNPSEPKKPNKFVEDSKRNF